MAKSIQAVDEKLEQMMNQLNDLANMLSDSASSKTTDTKAIVETSKKLKKASEEVKKASSENTVATSKLLDDIKNASNDLNSMLSKVIKSANNIQRQTAEAMRILSGDIGRQATEVDKLTKSYEKLNNAISKIKTPPTTGGNNSETTDKPVKVKAEFDLKGLMSEVVKESNSLKKVFTEEIQKLSVDFKALFTDSVSVIKELDFSSAFTGLIDRVENVTTIIEKQFETMNSNIIDGLSNTVGGAGVLKIDTTKMGAQFISGMVEGLNESIGVIEPGLIGAVVALSNKVSKTITDEVSAAIKDSIDKINIGDEAAFKEAVDAVRKYNKQLSDTDMLMTHIQFGGKDKKALAKEEYDYLLKIAMDHYRSVDTVIKKHKIDFTDRQKGMVNEVSELYKNFTEIKRRGFSDDVDKSKEQVTAIKQIIEGYNSLEKSLQRSLRTSMQNYEYRKTDMQLELQADKISEWHLEAKIKKQKALTIEIEKTNKAREKAIQEQEKSTKRLDLGISGGLSLSGQMPSEFRAITPYENELVEQLTEYTEKLKNIKNISLEEISVIKSHYNEVMERLQGIIAFRINTAKQQESIDKEKIANELAFSKQQEQLMYYTMKQEETVNKEKLKNELAFSKQQEQLMYYTMKQQETIDKEKLANELAFSKHGERLMDMHYTMKEKKEREHQKALDAIRKEDEKAQLAYITSIDKILTEQYKLTERYATGVMPGKKTSAKSMTPSDFMAVTGEEVEFVAKLKEISTALERARESIADFGPEQARSVYLLNDAYTETSNQLNHMIKTRLDADALEKATAKENLKLAIDVDKQQSDLWVYQEKIRQQIEKTKQADEEASLKRQKQINAEIEKAIKLQEKTTYKLDTGMVLDSTSKAGTTPSGLFAETIDEKAIVEQMKNVTDSLRTYQNILQETGSIETDIIAQSVNTYNKLSDELSKTVAYRQFLDEADKKSNEEKLKNELEFSKQQEVIWRLENEVKAKEAAKRAKEEKDILDARIKDIKAFNDEYIRQQAQLEQELRRISGEFTAEERVTLGKKQLDFTLFSGDSIGLEQIKEIKKQMEELKDSIKLASVFDESGDAARRSLREVMNTLDTKQKTLREHVAQSLLLQRNANEQEAQLAEASKVAWLRAYTNQENAFKSMMGNIKKLQDAVGLRWRNNNLMDSFQQLAYATRRFGHDIGNAFTTMANRLLNIVKTITGAVAAIGASMAAITTKVYNFGTNIIKTTEKLRGYNIALYGMLKTQREVMDFLAIANKVTRDMPLDYETVQESITGLALIAPVREMLLTSKDLESTMRSLFQIVAGLAQLQPEWGAKGAIFSLRNALTGDLRSLQRRFELPVRVIYSAEGKSLQNLLHDPEKMVETLATYISTFYSDETLAMTTRQFGMVVEKLKGIWFQFTTEIGNYGFYDTVINDLIGIREYLETFVDSSGFKTLAKSISDSFTTAYIAVKNISVNLGDQLFNLMGFGGFNITGIAQGIEYIAKSISYLQEVVSGVDLKSLIINEKNIALFDKTASTILNFGLIIKEMFYDAKEVFNGLMTFVLKQFDKTTVSVSRWAQKGILWTYLLGPSNITMFVSSITILLNHVLGLVKNFTKIILLSFTTMFSALKVALTSFITVTKKSLLASLGIVGVIGGIAYTFWDELSSGASSFIEKVTPIIETLGDIIVDTLEYVWEKFKARIVTDFPSIKNVPYLKEVFEPAAWMLADEDKAKRIANKESEIAKNTETILKAERLIEYVANKIDNTISETPNDIFSTFVRFTDTLLGKKTNNGILADEGYQKAVQEMGYPSIEPKNLKNIITSLKLKNETLQSEIDTIDDTLSTVDKVKDIGTNVSNLIERIKSIFVPTVTTEDFDSGDIPFNISRDMLLSELNRRKMKSVLVGSDDDTATLLFKNLTDANKAEYVDKLKELKQMSYITDILYTAEDSIFTDAELATMGIKFTKGIGKVNEFIFTLGDFMTSSGISDLLSGLTSNIEGQKLKTSDTYGSQFKSEELKKVLQADESIRASIEQSIQFRQQGIIESVSYADNIFKKYMEESTHKAGPEAIAHLRAVLAASEKKIEEQRTEYRKERLAANLSSVFTEEEFLQSLLDKSRKDIEKQIIGGKLSRDQGEAALETAKHHLDALFKTRDLALENIENEITNSIYLLRQGLQLDKMADLPIDTNIFVNDIRDIQLDIISQISAYTHRVFERTFAEDPGNLFEKAIQEYATGKMAGRSIGDIESGIVSTLVGIDTVELSKILNFMENYYNQYNNILVTKKQLQKVDEAELHNLKLANFQRLVASKYDTKAIREFKSSEFDRKLALIGTVEEEGVPTIGDIIEDSFTRAIMAFDNFYQILSKGMTTLVEDIRTTFSDGFFGYLTGEIKSLSDVFKNVGRSIKNTIMRIVADMLAISATKMVLGININAQGGMSMGGGLLGGLMGNIFGMGDQVTPNIGLGNIIGNIPLFGGGLGTLFGFGTATKSTDISALGATQAFANMSGMGMGGGIMDMAKMAIPASATLTASKVGFIPMLGKMFGGKVAGTASIVGKFLTGPIGIGIAAVAGLRNLFKTKDKSGPARASAAEWNAYRDQLLSQRHQLAAEYYMGDVGGMFGHGIRDIDFWTSSSRNWYGRKSIHGHTDNTKMMQDIYNYQQILTDLAKSHYEKTIEMETISQNNQLKYLNLQHSFEQNKLTYLTTAYQTAMVDLEKLMNSSPSTEQLNQQLDIVAQARDSMTSQQYEVSKMNIQMQDRETETLYTKMKYDAFLKSMGEDSYEMAKANYDIETLRLLKIAEHGKESMEYMEQHMIVLKLQKELNEKTIGLATSALASAEEGIRRIYSLGKPSSIHMLTYDMTISDTRAKEYKARMDNLEKIYKGDYSGINLASFGIESKQERVGGSGGIRVNIKDAGQGFENLSTYVQGSLRKYLVDVKTGLEVNTELLIERYEKWANEELEKVVLSDTISTNKLNMRSLLSNTVDEIATQYKHLMGIYKNYLMDNLLDENIRKIGLLESELGLQELFGSLAQTINQWLNAGIYSKDNLLIDSFGTAIQDGVYSVAMDAFNQLKTGAMIQTSQSGILGRIKEMEDFDIFRDVMGMGEMDDYKKFLGLDTSHIQGFTDPYEAWYDYTKSSIMQRINNAEEGSENWLSAQDALFELLIEHAERLKAKAENMTRSLEDMLDKIEETMRMRIAEERETSRGDVYFVDVGATRNSQKMLDDMLAKVQTNDPEAMKLIEEFRRKMLGINNSTYR